MRVPRIGISLGDPGGVGPEIILKALESGARPAGAAFIVFGDARVLDAEAARQDLRPEWRRRPDATAPSAPARRSRKGQRNETPAQASGAR